MHIDALPARPAIKERLDQLIGGSAVYFALRYRAGTLFAMKFDPAKQQPFLVGMRSPDEAASARVIVDPNAASDKGSISIQFYAPSLDGKLVAAASPRMDRRTARRACSRPRPAANWAIASRG